MGAAALITLNTMAINWHPSVNGTAPSYAGLIAEAVSQAGGILRDGAPTIPSPLALLSTGANFLSCLRAAFPAAGAYANEADYFEPDWSNSFWGANCTYRQPLTCRWVCC